MGFLVYEKIPVFINFNEIDFGARFSLYDLNKLKPKQKKIILTISPIIPIKLIKYMMGYFGRINSPIK